MFLERLAFSTIWELDDNAKIVSVKFHKSVIKSKSAFTYEEAQIRIDDKSKTDSLTESLRGLNYLAKKLKAQRLEDGALTLASVEVRFHLDSETADPIDLYTKELKETNSMVEEFMLLANCSVSLMRKLTNNLSFLIMFEIASSVAKLKSRSKASCENI